MSACILWPHGKTGAGYGSLRVGGRMVLAHRYAYCNHHGVTLDHLDGVVIRHTCDNPLCVNPAHLIPGTQRDNMRDKYERGRANTPRGSAVGGAVLDEHVVAEIRAIYKPRCRVNGGSALARRYGVNQSTISLIVNNHTW